MSTSPRHRQAQGEGEVKTKPPANENQRRVGYAEAAKFVGIKVGTLRSMVCRKQVPHIRLGPQLVLFDLDELERWLHECHVPATTSA
jgi:excisionase family DNA binding protein